MNNKGRESKGFLLLKTIYKPSILMIIVGVLFAIPTVIFLFKDFSMESILESSPMIGISGGFILGGIIRRTK